MLAGESPWPAMPDASKDRGALPLGSDLLCPFRLAFHECSICLRSGKAAWPNPAVCPPDQFDAADQGRWREDASSPLGFPESARLFCGAGIQTRPHRLGMVSGLPGYGDFFRFRLDQQVAARLIGTLLHLPDSGGAAVIPGAASTAVLCQPATGVQCSGEAAVLPEVASPAGRWRTQASCETAADFVLDGGCNCRDALDSLLLVIKERRKERHLERAYSSSDCLSRQEMAMSPVQRLRCGAGQPACSCRHALYF